MGAGGEEAFGVGSGCWDVFLFGGGDGAVDWGGVVADLKEGLGTGGYPPHISCKYVQKWLSSLLCSADLFCLDRP